MLTNKIINKILVKIKVNKKKNLINILLKQKL